jgi:hypothetical protein
MDNLFMTILQSYIVFAGLLAVAFGLKHWLCLNSKASPKFKRKRLKPNTTHLESLVIHSSTPKPAWVKDELIRLKALMPNAGCRSLSTTFNRLHSNSSRNMTVGKSFVAQVIKNHQYQITIKRREIRNRPPRSVAINDTWALDITFYQDSGHVQRCALGIIDHGSRAVVQLKALVNRRSWTLLGYLCLAIGQ